MARRRNRLKNFCIINENFVCHCYFIEMNVCSHSIQTFQTETDLFENENNLIIFFNEEEI